jgi:hypothetical protein
MRQRSLSEEGHKLFNIAYQSKPTRKSIRQLLNCLFHTADDKLIFKLTDECRKSSEELVANINNDNIHDWVNTFIQNIVVLILKKNDKIAKYHEAKKTYGLYLAVAKRALRQGDHNTAWLMQCSFSHKCIHNLNFQRGKKFMEDTYKKYGTTANFFQNHVLDLSDIYNSEESIQSKTFIPVAAILNMYSKKMHSYHKTYDDMGLKAHKRNRLKHIEDVVEKYSRFYSQKKGKQLIPMYLEIVQLPHIYFEKKIPFGDLLEASKQVKEDKTRRKSDPDQGIKVWINNPLVRRSSI